MSLETRFKRLANTLNIQMSDTDIACAVANFINFARLATELNDQKMRNFSENQLAATRQRILSACSNYTPERICQTTWHGNPARRSYC